MLPAAILSCDPVPGSGRGSAARGDIATVFVLAVLLLAGCGTVRVPSPGAELPLVRRVEARVGTAYAPEARLALVSNPLMRIEVGQASVTRVEQAFRALFAEAVELPDWPPWRSAPPAMDGVIELQRVDAELVLGSDTGANPDIASVRFHICLFSPGGTEIRCWEPAARYSNQRQPFDCINLQACVTPLVEVALREATARFLVEAESDSVLRDWAADVAMRRESP